MEYDLAEVTDFIQKIPPFEQLPMSIIGQLTRAITIHYIVANQFLPPSPELGESIYIVRKGALIYSDLKEQLLGKYGEHDLCTVFCKPKLTETIKVSTDEDTLLYRIPLNEIKEITKDHPDVLEFILHSAEIRLRSRMQKLNDDAVVASSMLNAPINQFYHQGVETISANDSIQLAAIKMTELNHSSLVVVDSEQPIGIITDKDLRRRCIAQGVDYSTPVSEITTKKMISIDDNSFAYDALMLMTASRIHHLPVTKNGKLWAMLTVTDLLHFESHHAINITHAVNQAKSLDDLKSIAPLLQKLQIRMAKLGSSADHLGKSISAITMAFTIKLIELAEQEFGSAPVPFAWLAAGSQARHEQLAHSDQDNAIVYHDSATEEDKQWFAKLADFVCYGLNECGFIYCPGNIMASNKKWRQSFSTWQNYFTQWVEKPEPEALLNCTVFFDLNIVYGDQQLLTDLRASFLPKTQSNSVFISHLARNALQNQPPLGFFRGFVLKANGKHKKSLDIKKSGIAPVVDLARIYALSEGIEATNTLARLEQCAGTKSLSKQAADNLIDAYQYLTHLRLSHQASQLSDDEEPDNYIRPKALSKLEQEHLKDSFRVIKSMQDYVQKGY